MNNILHIDEKIVPSDWSKSLYDEMHDEKRNPFEGKTVTWQQLFDANTLTVSMNETIWEALARSNDTIDVDYEEVIVPQLNSGE